VSVVLAFGPGALRQCRFAISPLSETTSAMRALVQPGREPYHLSWQRQARQVLPGLGLGPVFALLPPASYQPDFMSPPPDGPFTEISDDLARVRATPPEQVAAELRTMLATHPQPQVAAGQIARLGADPGTVRDRVADLLERAWSALVQPWWGQVRDVLDADITYRARQLADEGIAATLARLDRRVRWQDDDHLLIEIGASGQGSVADQGLVLLPSVFSWPGLGVQLDPPWHPTINYPARGIAMLWHDQSPSPADLARLIGHTRALLLRALAEPASTTGLAARCSLPVSTVSEQLAVLRAARLVTTHRTGRFLVHTQSALGAALAQGGAA
jgi:DNA-binding transcriptional ArsR family regulator